MSALTPFDFGQYRIRVEDRGDRLSFVGSDVCDVLGLHRSQLRKLEADEKGVCSMHTPGGDQEVVTVTEGGLYTLIFRCRDALNPGTMPYNFRRWVTGELLPSLRRTGRYGLPDTLSRGARQEIGGIVKAVATRAFADAAPAIFEGVVRDLVAAELAGRRFQLVEGIGATDVIELAGHKTGKRPRGLAQKVTARLLRFCGDRRISFHRSHRGRGAVWLFDEAAARLWLRSGGQAEIDAYVDERRGQGRLALPTGPRP